MPFGCRGLCGSYSFKKKYDAHDCYPKLMVYGHPNKYRNCLSCELEYRFTILETCPCCRMKFHRRNEIAAGRSN